MLEDVPGVGKTTLAKGLSRALGLDFSRVQFTPDLLPTDVLGASVLNPKDGTFSFQPGPVFHNLLLADEINRASPRTQSALLEAMNEGQVTIDGVSRTLPRPFFVIATQNPVDYQGTYPLPEAQLDRFLVRVSLGRGVVYNRYSGGHWLVPRNTSSQPLAQKTAPKVPRSQKRTRIELLEGDHRRFFLPLAFRKFHAKERAARIDEDGIVTASIPLEPPIIYSFAAGPSPKNAAPPDRSDLAVPSNIGDELNEIASRWTRGAVSKGEKLAAIATRLAREHRYSLEHRVTPGITDAMAALAGQARGEGL